MFQQAFEIVHKDMVSTKPDQVLCTLSTVEKAKEFIELYLTHLKESRNYEVKIDSDGSVYSVYLGNQCDFRLRIDPVTIFDCPECAFKDYKRSEYEVNDDD